MATVTYIKESKQHISAMKAVMCYCQREDKTTDPQTGHRYVSGVDCNGASSFTEFLATKTAYGKLDGINFYQENICEYLEKGIYTVEMFTKRSNALSKEIKQLQSSEADLLRQRGEGNQKRQAAAEIIPTTRHILDSYSMLSTEEKNRLWKLVMKKATVYRTPEGEMTIHIYPNLPK